MRRTHQLVTAVLFTLGTATSVGAEDSSVVPLLQPDAEFAERYGGADISAKLIVAARLGASGSKFAVDQIAANLSGGGLAPKLCARVTTRDARYWSLNAYDASETTAGPAQLTFPSGHLEELQAYSGDDVLLRVTTSENCDERIDGLILPSVGAAESGALHLYVNVGDVRTRAKLLDERGEEIAKSKCSAPGDGIAVSYTRICTIKLPPEHESGVYTVKLERRAMTGRRTTSALSVWLPGP